MSSKKFVLFGAILFLIFASNHAVGQEKLSLSKYLDIIRKQNLDLKIESAKLDSAKAKSIGFEIPPPTVSINQMHPETGSIANGYEINQTIPFPTKLTSSHSARDYIAKSQAEIRQARSQQILARAKLGYFLLWAIQEKIHLLEEKKDIITHHIKLARAVARSDSFAKIHLIKAETDLDLLENEIESTNQTMQDQQSQLALLINADPATFKIIAEEPLPSEVPKINSLETIPQIRSLKFEVESLKSKETQAQSQWLPDFNLGYKKMDQTAMAPRYNEIMVGVTLPFVFFWEPHAASKLATAERIQTEYELEKQRKTVEADQINLLRRIESLKKQMNVFKEKLIPRAESRMKLLRNIAPRDMETLQDHRETMEAFPNLKLQALDLRIQYEQTVADLVKYIPQKEGSYE